MTVNQPMERDTKSSIQKLYEAIPLNLLEMTKKGFIFWTNLGCTCKSINILRDADVYQSRFQYVEEYKKYIPSTEVQIITSDEDCYLRIGENLISNAQVCRLRNYIQSYKNEQVSGLYIQMRSFNEQLARMYEIYTKVDTKEDKK